MSQLHTTGMEIIRSAIIHFPKNCVLFFFFMPWTEGRNRFNSHFFLKLLILFVEALIHTSICLSLILPLRSIMLRDSLIRHVEATPPSWALMCVYREWLKNDKPGLITPLASSFFLSFFPFCSALPGHSLSCGLGRLSQALMWLMTETNSFPTP